MFVPPDISTITCGYFRHFCNVTSRSVSPSTAMGSSALQSMALTGESLNCPMQSPSSSDSLLSTTSNVLGILTFALSLSVSLIAFIAIIHGAELQVEFLSTSLQETAVQIKLSRQYFDELDVERDDDLNFMKGITIHVLNELEELQRRMSRNLETTQKKIASPWTRIAWWFGYKDVAAQLSKLEDLKRRLSTIQLNFLLRKLKTQNDKVLEVHRYTQDLWNGVRPLDKKA